MAILTARSFDCGRAQVSDADQSSPGNAAATNVRAHTGAYSMHIYGTSSTKNWARFAVGDDHPSMSVWIHPGNIDVYGNSTTIWLYFELGANSGDFIELRWNHVTHTFDAYIDGVLAEAGTVEVSMIDWFHVQFYAVIDNVGSIVVYIDGHESINYSGDTLIAADPNAAYLYLRAGATTGAYVWFDDLVIGNDGLLGDVRCIDIRPTADTAVDDWTPSAGDNYSTIDEVNTSEATIDTDYNEVNTDAQADELELEDFDGVNYVPVAITAWVRAKMVAATGDSIKVGIDSGGTDSVTERALSTDWEYYFHTDDLNPADAAEWEDADIDALKLRYESVIA